MRTETNCSISVRLSRLWAHPGYRGLSLRTYGLWLPCAYDISARNTGIDSFFFVIAQSTIPRRQQTRPTFLPVNN